MVYSLAFNSSKPYGLLDVAMIYCRYNLIVNAKLLQRQVPSRIALKFANQFPPPRNITRSVENRCFSEGGHELAFLWPSIIQELECIEDNLIDGEEGIVRDLEDFEGSEVGQILPGFQHLPEVPAMIIHKGASVEYEMGE